MNWAYRLAIVWCADSWSPTGLLRRAVFISLAYLVVRLAGLQHFATVLNGTTGSVQWGWEISALLGAVFILVYLAFVLVVPVLVLAAVILAAWRRLAPD